MSSPSSTRQAWEAARVAWPGVEVSEAEFADHVAERAQRRGPTQTLHYEDLYLACACVRGRPGALERFDEVVLSRVPAYLSRLGSDADEVDEVRQTLRMELLSGPSADGKPGIAQYTGQGSLDRWVGVAAVRRALNRRRDRGEVADAGAADLLVDLHNPELAFVKSRYPTQFQSILEEVLRSLPPDVRSVLGLSLRHGLKTTQIARLLGVSQPTAWRKLEAARARLAAEAKAEVCQRLGLSTTEFHSLAEQILSQLQLRLSDVLDSEPPGSGPASGG